MTIVRPEQLFPPGRTDLSTSTGTAELQHDGGFSVQSAPAFQLAGRGLSLDLGANLALVTLPAGDSAVASVQLDQLPGMEVLPRRQLAVLPPECSKKTRLQERLSMTP